MSDLRTGTAPGEGSAADAPQVRYSSREDLAGALLSGEGLEIGALHSPTPVPPHVQVRYADRKSTADLRGEYEELADLDLVEVDVIDDGEVLGTIPDGSQAFIIANHFLEHCEDPIGTIGNHLRKLLPGGALFYAVPDKRFTFDFRRPVTPIEHMIADHEQGPAGSRRGHYEEWVRLTPEMAPGQTIAEFETWAADHARELELENASIHMHVWTQAEFLRLILHCRERYDETFDIDVGIQLGPEFVVVLRKQGTLPS